MGARGARGRGARGGAAGRAPGRRARGARERGGAVSRARNCRRLLLCDCLSRLCRRRSPAQVSAPARIPLPAARPPGCGRGGPGVRARRAGRGPGAPGLAPRPRPALRVGHGRGWRGSSSARPAAEIGLSVSHWGRFPPFWTRRVVVK